MPSQCQEFKTRFIRNCILSGVTDRDDICRVVKEAKAQLQASGSEKQAESVGLWNAAKGTIPGLEAVSSGMSHAIGKGVGGTLANTVPLAALAYLGVPIAAGGAAGYGLAKARGLNDEDPAEIKAKEKIDAYRAAAEQAKLKTSLRNTSMSRRPSRPLI